MPSAQGQVGVQNNADGSTPIQGFRQGKQGDLIASELHGRYYEQNYRGNIFSGGMSLTAINAATFTTATLTASCTPIAGVWNPLNSGVNASIITAKLSVALTALQNTGAGPYVWAVSTGNSASLTNGLQPWKRNTLTQAGSMLKNLAGVALTGLTNPLGIVGASGVYGGNAYNIPSLGTAAGFSTTQTSSVEWLDGLFIVPPGGVLVLLATTTPVAHSVSSTLIWEEVLA